MEKADIRRYIKMISLSTIKGFPFAKKDLSCAETVPKQLKAGQNFSYRSSNFILASPPPVHKPGFYLFHHLIYSYSNRYLAPAILISTPSQISMISLFSSIWPPAMVPFVEFKSCT